MSTSLDLKSIPSDETITAAGNLQVFDKDGGKVQFGSLFETEKAIVVFIRHFFCGNCQEYVAQLASVSAEALAQAHTKIVVIGCGDYQPIKNYLGLTDFRGDIYADPTRSLYHELGMTTESLQQTPAGEQRKSYLRTGAIANAFKSIWTGPLKNPALVGKQGNISQLGGDFIFGPGNLCSFASRMRHTEDHVEVADLMQTAGVAYP
ncbi:hypothetical protein FIBSPDRAFT_1054036 [Athelia psychrophila]|uniref:AhpC-TSA-domain-containing protein n=1 Tax=Athelia psychrophila TaxID=1759441 RepID=A0A167W099_9AGAM|nr:hypothetical protein FIBSPDRAFT_1054036 [Fibularhizoctonia sp. CBS 109695]